jgi:hypothetical protein
VRIARETLDEPRFSQDSFFKSEDLSMFKRIALALVVLISLPFIALAAAVGYLLFAEWRERMQNPPTTAA